MVLKLIDSAICYYHDLCVNIKHILTSHFCSVHYSLNNLSSFSAVRKTKTVRAQVKVIDKNIDKMDTRMKEMEKKFSEIISLLKKTTKWWQYIIRFIPLLVSDERGDLSIHDQLMMNTTRQMAQYYIYIAILLLHVCTNSIYIISKDQLSSLNFIDNRNMVYC